MKKISFIVGIISLIIVIGFYMWSAMVAKKKSDDIVSKFNEINKEISASNDSIIQENKVAIEQSYPIVLLNNQIVLLIDSLKNEFENIKVASPKIIPPAPIEQDIKRLLLYIQQANKSKWDMADSRIPDTINYWSVAQHFDLDKWYATFFKNQSKEASITYLNYLKNQAIANNH